MSDSNNNQREEVEIDALPIVGACNLVARNSKKHSGQWYALQIELDGYQRKMLFLNRAEYVLLSQLIKQAK